MSEFEAKDFAGAGENSPAADPNTVHNGQYNPYATSPGGFEQQDPGYYQTPYSTGSEPPYNNNYNYNYTYPAGPGTPYYPQPQPKPQKKKKGKVVGIIALILCAALVFGSVGYAIGNGQFASGQLQQMQTSPSRNEQNTPAPETQQQTAPASESSLLTIQEVAPMTLNIASSQSDVLSIPDVVDKTADSVVEITTEVVATSSFMQQYITSGAGSGVIVSDNGYIITNNHVIDEATSITVTLHSGSSYPAALVGLDEDLDIALLKIEETGLTPATIGSSESLRVGQTIIAIGNPLGQLGGSVTSGIVAAKERSIAIDGTTMKLLQISASINPGNSGGALLDEQGSLVGIVNAKSSGSDVEGIGFAIPIDDVMEILDDLLEHGYVAGRPALGITMLNITTAQMAYMYRVEELGVYVYSINEGSAAEKGGLQVGDRILTINGITVDNAETLKAEVEKIAVGQSLTMTVMRDGKTVTLDLTMGEYIPAGIRGRVTGAIEDKTLD
ncbi:MAG: trypsin-like peptidase domain-containing protein [Lachnospiraceae bacterium]|nr:trypsin-like peptidase domain-containing protein [Lachnospiraceae bacterium]